MDSDPVDKRNTISSTTTPKWLLKENYCRTFVLPSLVFQMTTRWQASIKKNTVTWLISRVRHAKHREVVTF